MCAKELISKSSSWQIRPYNTQTARLLRNNPVTNDWPEYNTKLHLGVRLQSLSFGQCGVLIYCHYSLVHSDSLDCTCQGPIYGSNRNVQLFTKDYYYLIFEIIRLVKIVHMRWKNLITRLKLQYLKAFNCMQTNYWYQIVSLVFSRNTCYHLTMC